MQTRGEYINKTLYSYGNYYTWAAAMANTNNITTSSASESAGTSICPSGWHLPSSGSARKELGILSQGYGGTGNEQTSADSGDIISNRFRSFPNNFLNAGYASSSSTTNRGSGGYYWSRTVYSYDYTYNFNISPTKVAPSYYGGTKYFGFTIRCLISDS